MSDKLSSRIINAGWVSDAAGIPLFRALGDIDDPFRLTVLIADRLEQASRHVREDAEACKHPKTAWAERLYHFRRILHRMSRSSTRPYIGAIVDFDALYTKPPKGAKLWRDRELRRQRSEFFECLRDAVDLGGWLVLRPNVMDEVSKELPSALVHAAQAREATEMRENSHHFKVNSELRPVLTWLVEQQHVVDVDDVEEILSEGGPEKLETYALVLAYELLKPSVRATARCLSALRGPQAVNGTIGGFHIFGKDDSTNPDELAQLAEASVRLGWPRVSSSALEALEACGFVQRILHRGNGAWVHIPRRIRQFLRRLARIEDPGLWRSVNELLARKQLDAGGVEFEKLPIDEQLEVHHHAIQSGNIETAQKTAKYYGTDLREIAFHLSRECRFSAAAEVYRTVVNQFDAHDAYAWEYIGYNLAREVDRRMSQGGNGSSDEEKVQILEAYRRAVEEERTDNPLYAGRLLGFRAQCGEHVSVEFDTQMRSYQHSKWKDTARGYFARTVFDGLVRGGRHEERDELLNLWHRELQGNRFFEAAHDE